MASNETWYRNKYGAHAQSGSQGTCTYFLHSPSNLNRCGFQRNRNKYGTHALASIHISMRFEANTCCYYYNTNSCGELHTMNKCTFWYKYACPIFYLILVTKKMIHIGVNYYNLWISSYRVLMPTHVISDQTPTAAVLII